MNNVYNPVATYRVQFNKEFTFKDLSAIIPYLAELGIRTLYASPVFRASPGSMHGYDGTDPNSINAEIGTEQDLLEISNTLKAHHISWLQDIVPNHLSFHEENKWLMDVLEKGKGSYYAEFFDIDWNHPLYGEKLMVPFPGSPLEALLKREIPSAEHYVLCPWQETAKSINYRRFFTVNSLICINVQYENVFTHVHRLIKKLADNNVFAGLRVDHIDGLYDPKQYLDQLRKLAGEKTYLVVEKILEPQEQFAEDWPVQGNTGYDFLGMVNKLFTNKKSEQAMTRFYNELTGNYTPIHQQVREKKSFILYTQMAGELDNLCRRYKQTGAGKGLTDAEIRNSIAEYLIGCPVYRYYGDDIPVMDRDRGDQTEAVKNFYRRAMQFTGPLMAKGVEDTIMYTYNRFVGHNEVGDSPEFFGYTTDEFHQLMEYRAKHWPLSMNASSTHDTKRGEDARARLNALTDFYEEWIRLVTKWKKENGELHSERESNTEMQFSSAEQQAGSTEMQPDNNDEYFIYQVLVSTYPTDIKEEASYPSRLSAYLQKALREAKQHSGWAEPNTEYENACTHFAQQLINRKNMFWKSFHPFLQKVTDIGMINSFGQLVLKFTCPGVPDLYQGTEYWDLSMVDPDNRRPVDYSLRKKMLDSTTPLQALWPTRNDAEIKLSLTRRLLSVRNRYADFFVAASYIPVQVTGAWAGNIIAYLREFQNTRILSVVPLHIGEIIQWPLKNLTDIDWKDTRLILPGNWEDLLNGGTVQGEGELYLKDVFQKFPIGVLVN